MVRHGNPDTGPCSIGMTAGPAVPVGPCGGRGARGHVRAPGGRPGHPSRQRGHPGIGGSGPPSPTLLLRPAPSPPPSTGTCPCGLTGRTSRSRAPAGEGPRVVHPRAHPGPGRVRSVRGTGGRGRADRRGRIPADADDLRRRAPRRPGTPPGQQGGTCRRGEKHAADGRLRARRFRASRTIGWKAPAPAPSAGDSTGYAGRGAVWARLIAYPDHRPPGWPRTFRVRRFRSSADRRRRSHQGCP